MRVGELIQATSAAGALIWRPFILFYEITSQVLTFIAPAHSLVRELFQATPEGGAAQWRSFNLFGVFLFTFMASDLVKAIPNHPCGGGGGGYFILCFGVYRLTLRLLWLMV